MHERRQRAQQRWPAVLAALGWLIACGKDPPPQPLAPPALAAAAPAQVDGAASAERPQLPEETEEDAPPAGPAVEVSVAPNPAQPLAYYRGSTALGEVRSLHWSRKPMGHKSVAVSDGQVALRGAAKPDDAVRGPAVVSGSGPLLVSIGADWCAPCSQELGDVLELAVKLRRGKPAEGEVRLVMALEGTPDEWPLAEVRDRLFDKHAKHHKLARPLSKPPWAEFRADIESSWGAAVDRLGVLGGGKVALPVNLLLDRCGHIQAAASGSLDAAKKQVFAEQLAKLDGASCYPAPLAQAPVPPPRLPQRSAGDAKAAPRSAGPADAAAEAAPAGQAAGSSEGAADAGDPSTAAKPTAAEAEPPAAPAPAKGAAVKPPRTATETAAPSAKD